MALPLGSIECHIAIYRFQLSICTAVCPLAPFLSFPFLAEAASLCLWSSGLIRLAQLPFHWPVAESSIRLPVANAVHLSVALIATDRCSATLPSVHWTPDTLPRHQSRALLALIDSLCPANMQTQLSFSATNRGSPLSVANSVHICENMCMHCNFQACPLTFLYNENTSKNTKVMLKRHPTRQLVSDSRKKLRKQKLNRTCCPLQCTKKRIWQVVSAQTSFAVCQSFCLLNFERHISR